MSTQHALIMASAGLRLDDSSLLVLGVDFLMVVSGKPFYPIKMG